MTAQHEGGRLVVGTAGRVRVEEATLRNVDFSGFHFRQFSVTGRADFAMCNFSDCRFEDGLFSSAAGTAYRGCTFDRSRFEPANPGPARFDSCLFRQVLISEWFCTVADFVECTFSGTIERSKFFGKPFGPWAENLGRSKLGNEFRGNDFSQARLIDTAFVMGIDLSDQKLPRDGYLLLDRMTQRTNRASAAIAKWPDVERREQALRFLRGFHDDAVDGQEQAFIRPDDFVHIAPELRDSVLDLLRAD